MATINIKDVAKNAGRKIAEFYEDNKDEIIIYGITGVSMITSIIFTTVVLSNSYAKRYEAALMKGAAIGAAKAISKAIM